MDFRRRRPAAAVGPGDEFQQVTVRVIEVHSRQSYLNAKSGALGHDVVALNASPTMVAAAREAGPEIETLRPDAATLPFADASFDSWSPSCRSRISTATVHWLDASYNRRRRHSASDMLSPVDYEERYWDRRAAA